MVPSFMSRFLLAPTRGFGFFRMFGLANRRVSTVYVSGAGRKRRYRHKRSSFSITFSILPWSSWEVSWGEKLSTWTQNSSFALLVGRNIIWVCRVDILLLASSVFCEPSTLALKRMSEATPPPLGNLLGLRHSIAPWCTLGVLRFQASKRSPL